MRVRSAPASFAFSSFSATFALVLLNALTVGCASTQATTVRTAPGAARSGPVIEVAPVVVSPYSEEDFAAQFARARAFLEGGKPREAAALFERLAHLATVTSAPALPAIAPPCLLNAGIAHEELGDQVTAAERYRALLQEHPESEHARSALLRLARAAAYLERWSEVIGVAERLLARTDLALLEVVEARGARALGLVELDRVDEAAGEVARARDIIEEHRFGEAGKPPLELAQVSFALGEVRRRRSEAIRFQPLPADFAEALERRCQGLLDAQSAYTEAMRSLDARWSAMAGYRVGQLYRDLHRDLMQVTPPVSAASAEKKQLFEGAMRLRYRVLLEKGKKMMEGIVGMAARTGEGSAWVGRAREAQQEIAQALAEEQAALARLPYSEAELTAALAALKRP
ncbi:tetratricopeptide repeat protein [Chondromyces apiculatus]|uniref:Outer membrane lipoprotein BamD-like domain-containing protein n=1 Tax=Chondromyces apiculatus DSM 436 TaxID=1192034 RepID=A0A017SWB4_9BACT|nr:tetratricopeptide repeat protein [Chondromyces apiculatus]EYF01283.1 Hypothetical protein CAP_8437 [Chondromyces apiculatus DSM 436]